MIVPGEQFPVTDATVRALVLAEIVWRLLTHVVLAAALWSQTTLTVGLLTLAFLMLVARPSWTPMPKDEG